MGASAAFTKAAEAPTLIDRGKLSVEGRLFLSVSRSVLTTALPIVYKAKFVPLSPLK